MEIIIDLEYIKEIAKEKDEENWGFRAFLKQLDMAPREIDAVVHRIAEEVVSQIDCTKCANCCKQISPVLDKDDVSTFALGLKMPMSEFKEQYLIPDEEAPLNYRFKELPCPFLKNDRCSNYDYRPKDCRSYPHLHKKYFTSRLLGVIGNYEVCPIVFNTYEQLKTQLGHNNWRDDDDFEFGFEWE